MIKQAFKRALWVSLGVTIGGVLLPRILFPQRYNATYPPLALHALMYFALGYVVCFLTLWFLSFLKSKY